MIAVLTSVVFIIMAYRDSAFPPTTKNYTIEQPANQPNTFNLVCNEKINCVTTDK